MNMIDCIILFPILSFFILYFLKRLISHCFVIIIGVSSIFLSMLSASFLSYCLIQNHLFMIIHKLWLWFTLKKYDINFCLLFDHLSLIFVMMITTIGFLVSLFSIWYMQKKKNFIDFFAFINLFIFSMLLLVLSDNFIIMYVGWEAVGLCSYFLINFYYYKNYVNISSMKSFIITKIGDLFLISAILTIYFNFHTLNFYDIQFLIKIHIIKNQLILNIITILLLLGSVGKSAQIPLQTWLPIAMVGPTPVSALIHAATMVTAGVYLIIRNHDLFIISPHILFLAGILGSITLFTSSISAIFQKDIKKILAYSTMSQIGLMFISLSIGSWYVAMIHLITHAIFKALLFLSAGALILQCNNEKDIFNMGNQLWKKFPFLYICFLIGGLSLSAFPIITSGFYSKGNILFDILSSNHMFFFTIVILSTLLTTIYVSRLILIIFHKNSNLIIQNHNTSYIQYIPLFILLIFSTSIEKFFIPNFYHVFPIFHKVDHMYKVYLEIMSSIMIMIGFMISYYLYFIRLDFTSKEFKGVFFDFLLNLFIRGFYFPKIYNRIFVTSYIKIVKFMYRISKNKITYNILKSIKLCNSYLLCKEYNVFHIYIKIIFISMIAITFFISYVSVIFNYLK